MDPEQSSPEHPTSDPANPAFAPADPMQTPAASPGGASDAAPDPQAPPNPPDPAYPAYPTYPPGAPNPAYPAYPYPAYPYPPNTAYAPYAGYPPAGTPAQPSGAYPQPSGAYAPPSGAYAPPPPGESAPNSTALGAGYPQYPQYPAYPPQGAYPPNAAYPGAPYPPYPYPAAPSYPLYSPYASAPYGAPAPGTYPGAPQMPSGTPPPTPPTRRRRLLLPAILGGVAAVVIIAVVAVGLLALNQHGNPTTGVSANPTLTPFPTATSLPTATAFPGSAIYSDAIPGVCGDHPNHWATDNVGARVQCANGMMTLTHPTTEKYLATEFFIPQNYTFPSHYQVSVKIDQVTDGCGGVFVLGASNNGDGYAAYICADGTYKLVRYNASGNPLTVDENSTTPGAPHTLTVAVTPTTLDVSIDGQSFSTQPPIYTITSYLALDTDDISQTTNGSSSFSNFTLTA